eukprot:5750496-Pleurochrysis_carterae.AAC.1
MPCARGHPHMCSLRRTKWLAACAQLGADAWSTPTTQAWSSPGLVHALVSQSMSREADVLQAIVRVMHGGKRAGQLAFMLQASSLSAHVEQLKTKRQVAGQSVQEQSVQGQRAWRARWCVSRSFCEAAAASS